MTQVEFETRAKIEVSSKEFDAINEVYMNCDLDKDEFCKMWVKMNKSRINAYKAQVEKERKEQERKEKAFELYNKLNTKDWSRLAVSVMDEKEEELCKEIGIELTEWSSYYGMTMFRQVLSVNHELGKFCGAIRS